MIGTKRKGNKQEHRAMNTLESEGYACCRSAASLGIFDVVAIRKDSIKLIQVKSNRKPPKPERLALIEFAKNNCPANGTVEIWVYKDRIKEPEITVL